MAQNFTLGKIDGTNIPGVGKLLHHGFELTIFPSIGLLQLGEFFRLLVNIPGSDNPQNLTPIFGRFIVFFHPVFVKLHLSGSVENFHNGFTGLGSGAELSGDLLGIGVTAG